MFTFQQARAMLVLVVKAGEKPRSKAAVDSSHYIPVSCGGLDCGMFHNLNVAFVPFAIINW